MVESVKKALCTKRRDDDLRKDFRTFVEAVPFPCVGAKAALAREQITMFVAQDIRSGWDDLAIYPELAGFARAYRASPEPFNSFVVIFREPANLDEVAFEEALWARLQSLADKDSLFGHDPDPRVAADPDNSHFSLSFADEAFFVVGLHPRASRPARRFKRPALVFNLHDQFEALRQAGRYDKIRHSILARDKQLAGSDNPMLARHGEVSEARQYSGRAVDPLWKCPFERRDFSWGAAPDKPA